MQILTQLADLARAAAHPAMSRSPPPSVHAAGDVLLTVTLSWSVIKPRGLTAGGRPDRTDAHQDQRHHGAGPADAGSPAGPVMVKPV